MEKQKESKSKGEVVCPPELFAKAGSDWQGLAGFASKPLAGEAW